MTPIEFGVSMSKVKVTVTFKLGGIHASQTFHYEKFKVKLKINLSEKSVL